MNKENIKQLERYIELLIEFGILSESRKDQSLQELIERFQHLDGEVLSLMIKEMIESLY